MCLDDERVEKAKITANKDGIHNFAETLIQKNMKKFLMFLAIFASCSMMYADGGDDYVRIDVLLKHVVKKTLTRSCVIPITCYYDNCSNCLVVSFEEDLGEVTVTLTDQTNGATITDVIDSSVGQTTISVFNHNVGSNLIVYETVAGDVYSGIF